MKKNILKLYLTGTIIIWTALIFISLMFNVLQERNEVVGLARLTAESSFIEDQTFRFWTAKHGGIYVPVSSDLQPSEYLSHLENRDVVMDNGVKLTLMNPAFILRKVYESQSNIDGVVDHITSLKPLRPENAPNEWEKEALESFEKGMTEYFNVSESGGIETARFMRPMITTEKCLKCHEHQGYKVGDIRGGVSVSVPLTQYQSSSRAAIKILALSHFIFWILGLGAIAIAFQNIKLRIDERQKAIDTLEENVEIRTAELKKALDEVKTLKNIIPICCHCKKIYSDEGNWEQIEIYISNHLDSEFSHGICPDCMKKYYPDFAE